MIKIIFAIVAIFAVFNQLNVALRISEQKCAEYSTIPRSSDPKMHAHIVWIVIKTENNSTRMIGTLISEMFVLTKALETYEMILFRSHVIFSSGEQYDVAEKFIHPLFNATFYSHHNLALLRMEFKTILDSSHRPACLWTKNYFESAYVELYKCNGMDGLDCANNNFDIWSHKFLTGPNCTWAKLRDNTKLFCVIPSNAKSNEWISARGSPIQAYRPKEYLPENYFIYGIVSFANKKVVPNYGVGTKIIDHLDWIESIVWPETNNFPTPITTTSCGQTLIKFKQLITNSAPTFHGEFPWHAAIYISQGHGERRYICGGSLLNENTVLTAAHCVSDTTGIVSPELLIVSLGSYDLSTSNLESRESYVDRVRPHELFNRNHLENDIAILKLKKFIEYSNFIQPICIANGSTIFNSTVGVTPGWGRNEHNKAENILTKASLPILTNTQCRDIDRTIFPALLNDNNFCAGFRNGTSVCSGDSGGGLIFQYGGRSFIRGIVSLGLSVPSQGRCDSSNPAIFTDVVKFYYWIIDKL